MEKHCKAWKAARLTILFLLALSAVTISLSAAHAAQVAITVEKLTVDDSFLVEPTLVSLSGGQTAADVTIKLLSSKFPNVKAYSSSGSGETFYLQGVYDPARGELLSEFDEGSGSGWMITVENFFIRTSAGVHYLSDGDVIRWQYTKELGSDLGEDVNHLGTNTKADKDALVWKVAEINEAGDQSDYGSAYTSAVSVLTNLNAPQSAVNSALDALDGGSSGGGGCDAGAGIFGSLAAFVLAAVHRRGRK